MRNGMRMFGEILQGTRRRETSVLPATWEKLLAALVFILGSLFCANVPTRAQATAQASYSSPEDAMQALSTAVKAKDHQALQTIFGPEYDQLLSGDDVEDANDLNDFAEQIAESSELRKVSDSRYTMVVGKDHYSLPIPIVQSGSKWIFDTKAGLEEILNWRIGENELYAINTCRAYAIAQWEYFTEGDWDHDGVAEYAQHLISSPGEHDGLYWETAEGEKLSPLGALVAAARAEGYDFKPHRRASSGQSANSSLEPVTENAPPPHKRKPFHGYYLKILKGQGPYAPGGKYSYSINGNMIAGYALIACPDKWGNSGIMTFIINQQGRVYQKNLGPDTTKLANAITEYDPDPSWKRVDAQP